MLSPKKRKIEWGKLSGMTRRKGVFHSKEKGIFTLRRMRNYWRVLSTGVRIDMFLKVTLGILF